METRPSWTLGKLAHLFQGELGGGDPELPLARPAPAEDNDPLGIAFAESEDYLRSAETSGVGAVIVDREIRQPDIPFIRVDSPRHAFGMLLFMSQRPLPLNANIHPTAVVAEDATLGEGVQIGPYAVVESGARIGAKTRIYPYCYVGENCEIGAESCLYPHVTLYQDVKIGDRTIIHSGAVLGADGFGFLWDGAKRVKIPQVGGVVLGSDVEIGVNTAIDRATAGATQVGDGTKLDNLIQIGHNTKIGEHTVLAGMCGIPGSVTIGDRCVLGGGVGTNDHISITSDVTLGGRSSVDRDIETPGQYFGTPARPAAEALRSMLIIPKLPDMMSRLRKVEKKVGE